MKFIYQNLPSQVIDSPIDGEIEFGYLPLKLNNETILKKLLSSEPINKRKKFIAEIEDGEISEELMDLVCEREESLQKNEIVRRMVEIDKVTIGKDIPSWLMVELIDLARKPYSLKHNSPTTMLLNDLDNINPTIFKKHLKDEFGEKESERAIQINILFTREKK